MRRNLEHAFVAPAEFGLYIVRHSDPPSTLSLDEILDETPLSESGLQIDYFSISGDHHRKMVGNGDVTLFEV
jgi:hypothetical protein